MNKYLMLSAAAVLVGSAGSVNAGTLVATFTFGSSGGGSFCDGGAVYTSGGGLRAWIHGNNNCAGGTSIGQGMVGKLKAYGDFTGTKGKGSDMSDNFWAKTYGSFAVVLNYQLPKKIANGQPWTLTIGLGGTTSFITNSGVLANVNHAHNGKVGAKSTTSNLKTLIQLHRSSQKG